MIKYRVEVVHLDVAVRTDGVGHGSCIFCELGNTQAHHIFNTLHGAAVQVRRELLHTHNVIVYACVLTLCGVIVCAQWRDCVYVCVGVCVWQRLLRAIEEVAFSKVIGVCVRVCKCICVYLYITLQSVRRVQVCVRALMNAQV